MLRCSIYAYLAMSTRAPVLRKDVSAKRATLRSKGTILWINRSTTKVSARSSTARFEATPNQICVFSLPKRRCNSLSSSKGFFVCLLFAVAVSFYA